MKTKLFGLLAVCALSCGAAKAVVLTSALTANTANNVGLITTLVGGVNTTVTGTAYIYSSSTVLTAGGVSGVTTRAGFEALISSTPGAIRNVAFTNGAVASSVSIDMGAVGNSTYLWLQSTDGSAYGLYKGANVPSVGAVTFTSATSSDLIGTSVFTGTAGVTSGANTASGFQLVSVPEPSAALLGAIGALGLLRRRRI